ncbi:hypothetical protein [Streptomyces iconiensis]|uniref:DUF5709 domain-containing protein n=1 Tax=Streptomyces iconiensis TaxID=1384038 RepID=A0ABT6ZVD1_9ACTN|nr:hypothetical protein [Streptomyces iconiensis]MDJ1133023.1 hypothetical protein [Streptomyces iconiensis]
MAEDDSAREAREDVAGSDVRQPEIAEGPVEGLEPGERVERGPWTPPLAEDAPPGRAADARAEDEDAVGPDRSSVEEETATPPPDPGANPEDEGIPDLQDGTPEQQWASDPQQQPVPGDSPTAVTRAAPTPNEMREGESMDERLAQEEPEPETVSGEPSAASGRLATEPEPAPPRRQDIHSRETGGNGLSGEEEAVRTVDEDEV